MPPIVPIEKADKADSPTLGMLFMRFVIVTLFFLLPVIQLSAQQFVVKGELPKSKRSDLYLTIYDGRIPLQRLTCNFRDAFQFSGSVSHPVLASLSGERINGELFFYIENSNITISIDTENPSKSRINGSRTNSQYRYAMEECVGEAAVECAKSYVKNNPESIFSPYIIYDRLGTLPLDEIRELFELQTGEAQETYHYKLLSERISRNLSVVEGQAMPDFIYYDSDEGNVHFDSVHSHSGCDLILVGASWCSSCLQAEEVLLDMVLQARPHIIRIDQQPQKWDAPCLQQLVIDHIPYMILVDAEDRIAGRDLRIWELSRRMEEAGCATKKHNQKQ
ncbi:MAG: DUF4369 domain-containing protein [Bacteroidales bacterium]|nr:DUF4369 domain-containing protein [Bacteroidales bacterium]